MQPLYKHLINIKYPTMCLVGLPFYVCAFSLFDLQVNATAAFSRVTPRPLFRVDHLLQVRFFIKTLTGEVALPSTEEMLADKDKDLQIRLAKGFDRRKAHMMGPMQVSFEVDSA